MIGNGGLNPPGWPGVLVPVPADQPLAAFAGNRSVDLVALDGETSFLDDAMVRSGIEMAPVHLHPEEIGLGPFPLADAHGDQHRTTHRQERPQRGKQLGVAGSGGVEDRVEGHHSVDAVLAPGEVKHVPDLVRDARDGAPGEFDLPRREVDANDLVALLDQERVDRPAGAASNVEHRGRCRKQFGKPAKVGEVVVIASRRVPFGRSVIASADDLCRR